MERIFRFKSWFLNAPGLIPVGLLSEFYGIPHFVLATVSQRLVAAVHSGLNLLLIGQKARNSGCDCNWFLQLSDKTDNRCPITASNVIGHSPTNHFAGRLRKNRVLNEPIRFEEIVSLEKCLRSKSFCSAQCLVKL